MVVDKPLTVGVTLDYIRAKQVYLEQIKDKRKIVILAGSNGRFSHRCETIERALGVACANLSIAANLGLEYQLSKYRDLLRPGDVLYLPLEYRRNEVRTPWTVGGDAPIVARYDRTALTELGPRTALASMFSFDIRFLLSGIGEMLLDAAGQKRRFGTGTLTAQGDEWGHDTRKSGPYREFIRTLTPPVVDPRALANERVWTDVLPILAWARAHGVTVVGGLPTTFDNVDLPDGAVAAYARMFVSHGAQFLLLDNKSRYPREMFYDTAYHLTEEAQIRHSLRVAEGLRQFVR